MDVVVEAFVVQTFVIMLENNVTDNDRRWWCQGQGKDRYKVKKRSWIFLVEPNLCIRTLVLILKSFPWTFFWLLDYLYHRDHRSRSSLSFKMGINA